MERHSHLVKNTCALCSGTLLTCFCFSPGPFSKVLFVIDGYLPRLLGVNVVKANERACVELLRQLYWPWNDSCARFKVYFF